MDHDQNQGLDMYPDLSMNYHQNQGVDLIQT